MITLTELLPVIRRLGNREAVRFHDGYRTRRLSYRQLHSRIGAFAAYLDRQGLRKGDRVLLWGENRPEWMIAFWGCVARGVEVVPVDYLSSGRLVARIQREVKTRLLVYGGSVRPGDLDVDRISFEEVRNLEEVDAFHASLAFPDDVVEIVYTSGTTGDPKGAVHRHRNLCANLDPLRGEIHKYLPYLKPFQPIRILDLLPLSHMFGQSLGLYLPVLLGGSTVFMGELHPGAVMETIRRERVSALVAVPRMLENMRQEADRRFPPAGAVPCTGGPLGSLRTVWRWRRLHAAFGWKFWFFVVGGAQVDPEIEAFWRERGFAVVQGYGLTETSPVVALNHPFRTRAGSIGKPLKGQEVRIAPDGEILVRGGNVVSGYFGRDPASDPAFEEGWFHTGDLGEMDPDGRLYYRGRKKDVIVTAEGMNVHPQDVEAVLNRLPGIRESVVVPAPHDGGDRVHVAMILRDADADPEDLVRLANAELEAHQCIRSWSIWPGEDFPRTPSTQKIRRGEVARAIAAETAGEPEETVSGRASLEEMLARASGRPASAIRPETRLAEELGLTSLERVNLLSELEERYGVSLDEEAFTGIATAGQLKAWLEQAALTPVRYAQDRRGEVILPFSGEREKGGQGSVAGNATFRERLAGWPHGSDRLGRGDEGRTRDLRLETRDPRPATRWPYSFPVRWFRAIVRRVLVLPFFRLYLRTRAEGIEHLAGIEPPLLFAANHVSLFDTAVLLAALPSRWRGRLAPAMMREHFLPWLQPEGHPFGRRLSVGIQYMVARGLFGAFTLPRETGGVRWTLRRMGGLMDRGYCPLVFPEGRRTPDGRIHPFQPGIGLMALRLGAAVVPVHIGGLFERYSIHHRWPRPGPVRVRFGAPLSFRDETDYAAATRRVETAIRELGGEAGG